MPSMLGQTFSGKFLVVEGFHAQTREFAMRSVEKYLQHKGIEYLVTEELVDTDLGANVEALLSSRKVGICLLAEVFLVMSARIQHLHEVIFPALEEGRWVISEGFAESLYAFHGAGGISHKFLRNLEIMAYDTFCPDLVFFLDLNAAQMEQRYTFNTGESTFTDENIDFYNTSRNLWLYRAKSQDNAVIINGAQDVVSITTELVTPISYII